MHTTILGNHSPIKWVRTFALTFAAVSLATSAWVNAAPQKGGVLNLLAPYGASLSTLDPHATYDSQSMVVSKAFQRSLYRWDGVKNRPVLDLASKVVRSADGKTYTYTLFDNIYFHNGRKLTSDDVIWSFHRMSDPKNGFPAIIKVRPIAGADSYIDGKAKSISGLKKIDANQFSITFSEFVDPANLYFEPLTAILPKEEVQKSGYANRPVGLGPFVFVNHTEGSTVTGKRFDKYFKTGMPYADGVRFNLTNNLATAEISFRAGELDAVVLTEQAYVRHLADPKLKKGLIEIPEMFTRHIGFNTKMKPLNDQRVRQAINYAINRDVLIDKVLKGKAFKATGWLPSGSQGFDSKAAPYAYDVAKAKALMKEAGLTGGFDLELWVSDAMSTTTAEAITKPLAEIGVRLKIKVVDSNTMLQGINNGSAMSWFRSNGTGPDPVQALRCFDSRVAPAACNRFFYKDPQFDKMLDAAAAEPDEVKRVGLLKAADAYIKDKAPAWFYNYNKAVLAVQPWLKGVEPNPTEAAIIEVDNLWLDSTVPGRKAVK